RHATWSADGRCLYVINELSNTVKVIVYNEVLDAYEVLQTLSTLPAGYSETSYCADLHLHPNGKFLYGSNRGHNSIAMFAVSQKSGLLTALGQESTRGEYPRNFALDARGNFLYAANQNTSNITVYRVGKDGKLTYTGRDYEVKTPVCIEW
ncbi:MAG: beta-propeller fold lactonase family protein, partial [Bacteroidota bacterium]